MKKTAFYESFPSYMSDEGKAYILENFILTDFDDDMDYEYGASYKLSIDDFFEIVKAVRGGVAHEGNYWEMQFFVHDDYPSNTSLETDRQILKSYKYQGKKATRTYAFLTTMQYERFKHYFVEACINFLLGFMERNH